MKERASIVVEEYLQVIYSLLSEGKPIKAVNLANRLETSPSTVHATLSRMQRDALINIGKKKEIELTEEGFKKAENLAARHRLVETFLCDTLGIPWHEVHTHAHVMEHGLTPLIEEKLAEFLNFPETCPHGTPIPGSNKTLPENMIQLDAVKNGDQIEIVVIDESLEDSVELMRFLEEKKILPGKQHQVLETLAVTKTIILESEAGQVTIPFDIANKIGVIPVEE
ncbi:MAG: DtxR family transcriptional regulator [SAR324 cluster bacterium]|uniref:Manganese transport regulator n=1 Tax=SAR324 cluster bacterium TaxID=2024889 RepID=A0A2A4SQZ8_9DELT|nr:MAG: DtxR family transcriptional regulator [SAR324 cluster bacterium]